MTTLRNLFEQNIITSIEARVMVDSDSIDLLHLNYNEFLSENTYDLFELITKENSEFLDDKWCEIAEQSEDFSEDGGYFNCNFSITKDNQDQFLGQVDYVIFDTGSFAIESDLTIDIVQDKLNSHEKAKHYLDFLGGSVISLHYSGGGDDGSLEELRISRQQEGDININFDSFDNTVIEKQITSFAMAVIDNLGYDWWNCEGGYGDIHISIDNGKVTCLGVEAFRDFEKPVVIETRRIKEGVVDFLLDADVGAATDSLEMLEKSNMQWKALLNDGILIPLSEKQSEQYEEELSVGMSI